MLHSNWRVHHIDILKPQVLTPEVSQATAQQLRACVVSLARGHSTPRLASAGLSHAQALNPEVLQASAEQLRSFVVSLARGHGTPRLAAAMQASPAVAGHIVASICTALPDVAGFPAMVRTLRSAPATLRCADAGKVVHGSPMQP